MTNQTSSLQPGRPARPILDAFYLPRGLLGRVGGTSWPAACPSSVRLPTCAAPGIELCDLGCGPGVLAGRHPQLRLHLVDPSPVMRSQAARRCRQWQREGRVDISPGTADQIPPADAACDTVISVNTVVMWPDLAAGLREIRRVLRPHGDVVLSWHSATAPSRTSRRLALSDSGVRTLSEALRASFGNVQRHDLTHSVAWQAQGQP